MTKSTKAYAEALIDLCNEQNSIDTNSIDTIINELQLVSSFYNDEFIKFLSYPKISKNDKKALFNKSFKDLSKLAMSFIYVLIDNNDITNLPNILVEVNEILMNLKGISKVIVETTKSLNAKEKDNIINYFTNKLNKQIIIEEVMNPNLIGGIIIKYEGKVIDGSLITKEKTLKEYLKK